MRACTCGPNGYPQAHNSLILLKASKNTRSSRLLTHQLQALPKLVCNPFHKDSKIQIFSFAVGPAILQNLSSSNHIKFCSCNCNFLLTLHEDRREPRSLILNIHSHTIHAKKQLSKFVYTLEACQGKQRSACSAQVFPLGIVKPKNFLQFRIARDDQVIKLRWCVQEVLDGYASKKHRMPTSRRCYYGLQTQTSSRKCFINLPTHFR